MGQGDVYLTHWFGSGTRPLDPNAIDMLHGAKRIIYIFGFKYYNYLMDTEDPQTYKQLLIRLASINAFFVIFMTITAFFIFISYDTVLWQHCHKTDIFKVFFQNIRFNLSIVGYFNMPVFILLIVFLAFRPTHITKLLMSIMKSYYTSAFVASFSLLTLSYLLKSTVGIDKIMSEKYFSKLAAIYSSFDNPTFIATLVIMSILFLITVIFFILFFKTILRSREYTVDDYQKSMISTVAALLLCIFFAKGKIIGHLTVKDAIVTPVVQLNDYAIAGPYKIFSDLRRLDTSNIHVIKDKKALSESGLVMINSEDEEKAKQMLFQFYPKQEE